MDAPLNDVEMIFTRPGKQLSAENGFAANHSLETSDKKYSLVKFVLGGGNRRKASISAEIRGDEPGGVGAICAFLENNRFEKFSDEWGVNLFALPETLWL